MEDPSEVCGKIKAVLKEEIAKALVTARDIERHCHEKWKKKTRPKKNDKASIPEATLNRSGDESASTKVQELTQQPDGDSVENNKEEEKKNAATEEEEDLLDKVFTIPAEKFGEVIEAMRASKNGLLLQFNAKHELVSVQAN